MKAVSRERFEISSLLTRSVGVSELNTLPQVWIERPETTLVTTFTLNTKIRHNCLYTVKPRMKNAPTIQYSYLEQVRA